MSASSVAAAGLFALPRESPPVELEAHVAALHPHAWVKGIFFLDAMALARASASSLAAASPSAAAPSAAAAASASSLALWLSDQALLRPALCLAFRGVASNGGGCPSAASAC